ncbi:uncharacterized protein G2W53_022282 [Senna tora]|uniref:Uncharacterized protein n=1 Tax=Senna tora TaxID=362788 RepID=A0A834TKZ1_9FABA|nr:uncharacterized protein G2W53_022282 [Senna tora]
MSIAVDVGEDFVMKARYDVAIIATHKVKLGSGNREGDH